MHLGHAHKMKLAEVSLQDNISIKKTKNKSDSQSTAELTDETVHVVRVAGVVWDGEAAITDGHLTLSKRQCEITQLIQQAAQSLRTQAYKSHCVSEHCKKTRRLAFKGLNVHYNV